MIACAVAIWLFIAACVFRMYTWSVRVCPETMPGGRYKAIAATSFAWPMIAAVCALAGVVMLFDAVAVAFTRR